MSIQIIPHPFVPTLPALISAAGDGAAWRFLEFFTLNIRNPNTRAAYGRAAGVFLSWCEKHGRGIGNLRDIQPIHVAAYIEELQRERSAPTVKQHLAWYPNSFRLAGDRPGGAVQSGACGAGPAAFGEQGITPVLSSEEASALLKEMKISHVVGLRDRAVIAVMTYAFARASAVVALNVEDYFPQKKRWWLRLAREERQDP